MRSPSASVVCPERLDELGMLPLGAPWSKIVDYSQYMAVQEWVRKHFTAVPVEAEYDLWLKPRMAADAKEQENLG